MPLNPGVLQVTFNPPGSFQVDKYHTVPASEGLTPFTQGGCTKQVMSNRDKIDNTTYAEATDKFYTPYNTNTAAVDAEWHISYAGKNYRVLGVRQTPDAWGRIYFCKFITKEESG